MTLDFEGTLRLFVQAGIDFILVGGVSAIVRGAPVHTFDIDLVHSRTPANIERLLPLLELMDAIFRIQPHRRLRPNASHLSGCGHINLITSNGPLDLLCTIGANLAYNDLLPHSDLMDLGDGLQVCVLRLEKYIELKEQLNTDKDRAVLPLLRQTLGEIRKRTPPPPSVS